MARRPRLELPGIPLHITQRGVNRGAVFVDDDDRRHYLHLLSESVAALALALHAYVLMGNHVHLPRMLATAMRRLGQCHVQAFNRKYGRTGPLLEGRFKSCLVASDTYLLRVYRYIELNPVRAALVVQAEDYPWSSVHGNLGKRVDPLLRPHETFAGLGRDTRQRSEAYRRWLDEEVSADELESIRRHVSQERALGSERFQAMVEKTLGRPARVQPRGRPRRVEV